MKLVALLSLRHQRKMPVIQTSCADMVWCAHVVVGDDKAMLMAVTDIVSDNQTLSERLQACAVSNYRACSSRVNPSPL